MQQRRLDCWKWVHRNFSDDDTVVGEDNSEEQDWKKRRSKARRGFVVETGFCTSLVLTLHDKNTQQYDAAVATELGMNFSIRHQ